MPELPEVETVIRELKDVIIGKKIRSYSVLWGNTFVDNADRDLSEQKIEHIGRKGKYILLKLNHTQLIIHLRMTGKLLYFDHNIAQHKHDRFVFDFSDNSRLVFNDVRKFGRIYHSLNSDKILEKVGMDAMDSNLTADYFYGMLQKSRRNIKSFLLSQMYISGLGNIYVDEALFRANISPFTICANIPQAQAVNLLIVIKDILSFAIKNMGTTISDYRDAFGNFGSNQNFLKVYQRNGLPCFNCGNPIEKITFAGRGTHYCASCQKIL